MQKNASVVAVIVICGISTMALASSVNYTPPTQSPESVSKSAATADLFKRGQDAIALGNYADAEESFFAALKAEPRNPDILNMLAYSQRKQGKLDKAFSNYYKALAIRPNYPQAREYLGEAHIQAALEQIKTLKGYGAAGKADLEKLTAALKEAATTVEGK